MGILECDRITFRNRPLFAIALLLSYRIERGAKGSPGNAIENPIGRLVIDVEWRRRYRVPIKLWGGIVQDKKSLVACQICKRLLATRSIFYYFFPGLYFIIPFLFWYLYSISSSPLPPHLFIYIFRTAKVKSIRFLVGKAYDLKLTVLPLVSLFVFSFLLVQTLVGKSFFC